MQGSQSEAQHPDLESDSSQAFVSSKGLNPDAEAFHRS